MKIRVRGLTTGKKIKPMKNEEFWLDPDGKIQVIDGFERTSQGSLDVSGGYVVEFSFAKDSRGEWMYEHCVVND